MIEINFDKCEDGRFIFSARGHADKRKVEGPLVCAAVSALVYNFYLAVRSTDIEGEIEKFYHSMDKGEAVLDFTVKKRYVKKFETIAEILMDGIFAIAERYPGDVTVY